MTDSLAVGIMFTVKQIASGDLTYISCIIDKVSRR